MTRMSALGIGFAGLDIIKKDNAEFIFPGGTCGNVISVLAAMLNWKADIIKSSHHDSWNDYINFLWRQIGVGVIECGLSKYPSPRIVEVIDDSGSHQYTVCPKCKSKLININSPSKNKLSSLDLGFSEYDLLYYDRISEGTKYLLEIFTNNRKWTFYEPNSARNYENWLNNIAECNIVKFSEDRIPRSFYNRLVQDLNLRDHRTKMVLITHSQQGYSYSIYNGKKMSEYKTIGVHKFAHVIDSSGAGDYLSAGFLHKLLQYYSAPTEFVDEKVVVDALSFGHSLAEIACKHVGALGGLFESKDIQKNETAHKCNFCKLDKQ